MAGSPTEGVKRGDVREAQGCRHFYQNSLESELARRGGDPQLEGSGLVPSASLAFKIGQVAFYHSKKESRIRLLVR